MSHTSLPWRLETRGAARTSPGCGGSGRGIRAKMHRSSESIASLAAALAKAQMMLTNPEKKSEDNFVFDRRLSLVVRNDGRFERLDSPLNGAPILPGAASSTDRRACVLSHGPLESAVKPSDVLGPSLRMLFCAFPQATWVNSNCFSFLGGRNAIYQGCSE
jgi:hypothetical protein